MATLRRNLVEKVKKAAAKVSSRGAEVATKAGTRGARAIVETTVAAVKTVDTIQKKLGRGKTAASKQAAAPKAAAPVVNTPPASDAPVAKQSKRSAAPANLPEAPAAVMGRDAGRKTMPAASAKRAKPSKAAAKEAKPAFKAKRGQKHLHTGR